MPYEQLPPQVPHVSLEDEPLKLGAQQITDSYALQTVNQTFWQFEWFRSQNHDKRWNAHDALYYGWVPQKVWDGTQIPRSSLGRPIVFDQVEAALPSISAAIFSPGPDWFQVEPMPGADPKEARQIQDNISYTLEHPKDQFGFTARNELELAFKSLLIYGQGGISVEWDPIRSRPVIEWVDIRDLYIDAGLSVPNIEEGRATIRRRMMTIEEVEGLRADRRMSIPPSAVLWYMAQRAASVYGDQTKRVQEALRGVYYSPGTSDWVPLPADRKIEVLVFYSKTRIIWVLNREWVAYNGPNPYGFTPFCFAPCYIVPGRFYAMSIGDVQEGNQRVIEALLNSRLDEVHLALHPPRVMPRSTMMTPAQQKWRPGQVYMGDDPKQFALLQPQSALPNVYAEIQYFEGAAEKSTGVNSIGQGVPRPSNANRTQGGMQMQLQGSANRLQYVVSNIENYLILPMLYKIYLLTQFHTRYGQFLPAARDGQHFAVPAGVFQKPVRFRMHAASRMLTRDKLIQIFPFLFQYIAQGPFLAQLTKVGKTVDFEELIQMLQDATGTGRLYRLIRPMNEQETQQAQQPPPEVVAQQQQAQQEQQIRLQMADKKIQGDLMVEQVKKQPNPAEIQMKMQEMQAKIQLQEQVAKIKIEAERQKAIMDLAKQKQDLQLKSQEAQLKFHTTLAQAQADTQAAEQRHQVEMRHQEEAGEQNRYQEFTNHALGLDQQKEKHEVSMQQMKEKNKIKPIKGAKAAASSAAPSKKAKK